MYDTSSDSKILLDTVQKFMADEIYPHEDRVDKLGHVPDEIGKQIEEFRVYNSTRKESTNNRIYYRGM